MMNFTPVLTNPGQLKNNILFFFISVKRIDQIPHLPRDYYLRSDGAFGEHTLQGCNGIKCVCISRGWRPHDHS